MSLFQNSVLNKYLRGLDTEKVDEAYAMFTRHFHNPEVQENIRNSKEEQYQGGFLIDLFVNVLGYIKNPNPTFNITTELKNVKDSKKTDGAVVIDGKVLAVIELKGTNTTDLSKVEAQAFGYMNNQPGCNYVITSNFEKLRFYIDNAVDFEEFNLFQMTRERFNILWLCISAEYLLKNLPKKIKDESLTQEENITVQLYKDYAAFRNDIFGSIQKENPEHDKLTLFKKTQKLLDRFLFIFFAEDRLLLPPNSIRSIVNQWKELRDKYDEYFPLYDRFNKFFGYMNTGHKGQHHEIFAYNGGLFAPDEVLDNIKIDDEILYKHTLKLSNYNYESEVDVNILGHIFEHSLNEIETIQSEIKGVSVDKSNSKRKKDGVFYTPKYITKYIVKNTVGKLCEEKKTELDIQEEEYEKERKGRRMETLKNLIQKLEEYRAWLLQITICDPACGSGAFLNQALEFLIAEHRYIDELHAKLLGVPMIISEVENSILENNLYGVDINEESVEIAKLSLWLRTAQRGRALTSLNDNIKCGNSLIDDPAVAEDKAFDWKEEFPEIFSKGGFDVVIRNPPYGAKVSKKELDYLVDMYKDKGLSRSLSDTYIAFYIKSLENILRKDGLLSFITPNTWRLILNGKEFRDFITKTNYSFQEIIQHQEKVFADATVDCDTLFIKKQYSENHIINIQIKEYSDVIKAHSLKQSKLAEQNFFNLFLTEDIYKLKQKIEKDSVFVKDELTIKNGVKPYEKGKGKPAQTAEIMKEKPFTSEIKLDNSFSPLIGGSSFHRYKILWDNDFWIKYGEWLAAPRDEEIFTAPEKLIFRQTGDSIIGAFVDDKYIMRDNTHIILPRNKYFNLKYVLSVLNSKLSNFIYWTNNPEKGEAMAQIKLFHLGLLCFKNISKEAQQPLIEKADQMLNLNKELLQKKNKYLNRLRDNFEIDKISNKIDTFYDFDFKTLLAELKKIKVNLSLLQQDEWEEYFVAHKTEINTLQNQINQTDNEIDQMVYQLYGLTEDEIKIVEEASL